MKTSSFFPSLGLLVILNLIVKPVWIFAIDREVQNEVGTTEYGVYFSLLGLSVFFNFLLDWGLTIYYNRQLAADPENFRERAGSYLLIKLLFAVFYAGLIILIAKLAGVDRWDILIPVILIQVLTSLFVFLRGIITARQWFKLDAWMSVIDKTLMIFICGSFLYFPLVFGKISLQSFLVTQIICTALSVLVLMIILIRNRSRFDFIKSFPGKEVFRSTLPYAIIVLLMSAHYRFDAFMLERLHPNGQYQAGLYAGAFRLLDAANMIGFLFASFLLPYLSNLLGKRKEIQTVLLTSRHLLLIFSIFVSVTAVFKAGWLQSVLYDHQGADAVEIMQWCIPVLIVYSLVHLYGTVLTARAQLIPFCYILLISVAINVVLNLMLIEPYGAKGCCISALISQGFCGIATMIFSKSRSGIAIDWRSWTLYILTGVILGVIYFLSRNTPINQWILIFLVGVFTLALSIQFKLVNFKLFQQTILNKEENENA